MEGSQPISQLTTNPGQFERTLIIADRGATSAVLKAHGAEAGREHSRTVVETYALTTRRLKIFEPWQNVSGDSEGRAALIFVTKRALPRRRRKSPGRRSIRLGITGKYPSCIIAWLFLARRSLFDPRFQTVISRSQRH